MVISRTALRRGGLHDTGRLGEAHPSLVGKAPIALWELVDVSPAILVSECFDKVQPAKELAVGPLRRALSTNCGPERRSLKVLLAPRERRRPCPLIVRVQTPPKCPVMLPKGGETDIRVEAKRPEDFTVGRGGVPVNRASNHWR
jgi:hypothetical protein